jgi:uncharacterized membrane protein
MIMIFLGLILFILICYLVVQVIVIKNSERENIEFLERIDKDFSYMLKDNKDKIDEKDD